LKFVFRPELLLHETLYYFLENVEIFRYIFSRELFFGQGKERIFWNVFWKMLSSKRNLSKLINQLIDMCGSCPCITILLV